MRPLQTIHERAVLGMNDMFSGLQVKSFLREFRKVQKRSEGEVKDYQLKKIITLLSHAGENSPYYRELFKTLNFVPDKLQSLVDLKELPILNKETLLNHSSLILSEAYNTDTLYKGSSSGSTGTPIIFYTDIKSKSAGKAAGQIAWELTPWKFGMKGLHIWGHPETVNKQWNKLSSRLKARLYRHHKFAAHNFTDPGRIRELYELCNKEKYVYLDGYTMAIYIFAKYLSDQSLKVPSVKFVLTTGENLQDYQREVIEAEIGPVYDLYGCSEINGIANECSECGQYHTIDPHVYVEFSEPINDEGDCKLIITDLDNYAFPLIRYENGDLGKPGDHQSCSVPFGTMKAVSGRVADLIILENGGVLSVPGFFASTVFKHAPGLKQYQVVRDKADHLIIKIVINDTFDGSQMEFIKNAIEDYLGDKIKWDIEIVKQIPISKSGKTKLVVDLTA